MEKCGEADVKDTWKLEDMVPGDSQWEKLSEEASLEVKQYADFRGKLTESPDSLYQYLKFDGEVSRKIEFLYAYARMRSGQNTAQRGYQGMFAGAQPLSYKASECSSFIVPEILSMPEGTLGDFMKAGNGISHFGRALEIILDKRQYTLSGEVEGFLAQSYDATQGVSQIFTMFNNTNVKFPVITGENGEGIQITHGNYISLTESEDRRIGKDAFGGLYNVYAQYSNTLAAIFSSNIKQAVFYARVKRYESSRQYYLTENRVPELVCGNLVQVVRKNLPKLYRHTALRKTRLEVNGLHTYDLCVPTVSEVDRHYTYEGTKAIVKEGLVLLGEEYLSVFQEGFGNHQIDVYEDEGKRSGAYSQGTHGSHPYVLLNFHGTLDDVFTLTHEMGHSIHSWYSDKNRPFTYAGYRAFVAEVASIYNEALLIRHLLGKTGDKKEKTYLLNHFLESSRGTLFHQTILAEFENMTRRKGAAGENLTTQNLRRGYHQLNADHFGGEMTVDPQIDYEWERIPHFYTPFYVYQYATSFSAAVVINNRIVKGEPGALESYKKFLSGGCSITPIDFLKLCGVDMSTTKPMDEALNSFGELLEEFEEMDHN